MLILRYNLVMAETKNTGLPKNIKSRFIDGLGMERLKECIVFPLIVAWFAYVSIMLEKYRPEHITLTCLFVAWFCIRLLSYKKAISEIENNQFTWYTADISLLGDGLHAWIGFRYVRFVSKHFVPYDSWSRVEVYVITLFHRPGVFLKGYCTKP